MKFLVVGAGAQGGPCAAILSKDPEVSRVVLADIDRELLDKVSKRISAEKLTTVRVDAAKLEELKNAARGVDVVINLISSIRFNANIMEAAVESGAHYVDAAMDYAGIRKQLVEGKPLDYDEKFRNAGLTALLNCGAVPGITNVLARYICDKFERVDSIRIVHGDNTYRDGDSVEGWNPPWSPDLALSDIASEVDVFRDGKFTKVPPFSGMERYVFPDPIGPLLVSLHCHEEPCTLPRFIGKGVKDVDFRHPVDKIAAALIKLGLASNEPIDVKGVKVSPRDVLLKLVPLPGNAFLAENETSSRLPPNEIMCTIVEVRGTQSGEKVQYTAWYFHSPHGFLTAEEMINVYSRLGTTMGDVAFPAVVGAKLCVRGAADKGVIFPECLDPKVFFGTMAEMGAPMRLHETVSRVLK